MTIITNEQALESAVETRLTDTCQEDLKEQGSWQGGVVEWPEVYHIY